MNAKQINYIQTQIGYPFRNPILLRQAFTRKSYTNEHPKVQNNEVLEFHGDSILNSTFSQLMTLRYGHINTTGEFVSDFDQDQLTRIRQMLVCKTTLSRHINALDLSQYLIVGRGDCNNGVQNQPSVKEALFEAILGAVALDCDWNWATLLEIVERMLSEDEISKSVLAAKRK